MDKEAENIEFSGLDEKFPKLMVTNPWSILYNLKNLMRPRRISDGHWMCFVSKGRFELHDYGCGLYSIYIRTLPWTVGSETKGYSVQFHVGCADDGSWAAWSSVFDNKDHADKLVEKLSKLLPDLTNMPTSKELNDLLFPFGLYGEFE